MQNRFRQILEDKNITAKVAAEMIGINASAISHLLNGNRKPSFEVIEKIALAFPDLNMNWFIQGIGLPWNNEENPSNDENNEKRIDRLAITLGNSVAELNGQKNKRTLQRVLLFFDDGSFEEYNC